MPGRHSCVGLSSPKKQKAPEAKIRSPSARVQKGKQNLHPERIKKKGFHFSWKPFRNRGGAPGRIRTRDPLVRSQVLYPTELLAHSSNENEIIGELFFLCKSPCKKFVKIRVSTYNWTVFAISMARSRTGLGLSLSHTMVTSMQGSTSVSRKATTASGRSVEKYSGTSATPWPQQA